MKKLFYYLGIIAAATVMLTACGDDDTTPQVDPTIVDLAIADPNLSSLVAALTAYPGLQDLVDALDDPDGTYTVFAPDNAAFAQLLADLGVAAITDIPEATLRAVLEYHVLTSEVLAADLPVTTVAAAGVGTIGGTIYVSNNGGGVFINGTSQVTDTDNIASNGAIHVISKVLVPASNNIAEIVAASASANTPEFTLLLAALNHAGLTDTFTGPGPFTVFAPTDAAFNAAGFADAAAIEAVEASVIAGILTHHVVEASAWIFSSDLADGAVTMLNTQDVTIDATALTVQDAAGSTPPANIVAASSNVLATNGVIHVIDAVLLPTD